MLAALACAAAPGFAPGCASASLAKSERETGEILGELAARVEKERTAARSSSAAAERTVRDDAPADVPPVVDLPASLRLAGRHNRDLLRDRDGLVQSALALRSARNRIGPRLSGTLSWALAGRDDGEETDDGGGDVTARAVLPTGAEASVTGAAGKTSGRSDASPSGADAALSARISQPLLRGAGYDASHEALTDAERQSLYDVRAFELSRQDLALEVQRTYYGLVSQRQVIRNRESTLESFEFLRRRSERLFELGRVSEVDKFRAAREYLTAENALVDARQDYETRLDRFKVLLGLDTTAQLDVAETIPDPRKVDMELRRAVETGLANRLDLMTARDQAEDAERKLRIRERELLPDLRLDLTGARAASSHGYRDVLPLERDTWGVGFSLELPLDRVDERGAVRSARIAVQRSRRDLSLREDQVVLDVRESLRDLRSAESSLEIQRQIVASEEKNVKIARLRFEEGEIGNRDLTDALASLADAKDRFVREKANVEIARLALLRALGTLTLNEDGTWRD
ncbi:MAG: hypothetical protein HMLKMBBP_03781 [Planctomycetes bacterium]|nr:hypothetical protein [Planctomycetota bacterium]